MAEKLLLTWWIQGQSQQHVPSNLANVQFQRSRLLYMLKQKHGEEAKDELVVLCKVKGASETGPRESRKSKDTRK